MLPSKYTNLCKFDSIVSGGTFMVDLGSPKAESSLFTVKTTASEAGLVSFGDAPVELDATYGRNITVVASGADTAVVTIRGYDYLYQPMTETLTLNGATKVVGNKAFKYIREVSIPAGTAATITVGTGSKLGMPVRCVQVLAVIEDGVKGTVGTLTAPVNTKQTATSTDPRGLLQFTITGKHLVVIGVADDSTFMLDDVEFGGLYGIPHYQA